MLRPSANTLVKMTPQDKDELFNQLKLVQKRNETIDRQDPEKVIEEVLEGKLDPCKIHEKKAILKEKLERTHSIKGKIKESRLLTLDEKKLRAKSNERQAIKQAFSGMDQIENHYFEEMLKNTMKQIDQVNSEFKTQKLMQKIKEKGSLYGKVQENNREDPHKASNNPTI